MPHEEVKAAVSRSLRSFLAADIYLLEANASERSITHRLACHLSEAFPGLDVDCEFNRIGRAPKRLSGLRHPPVLDEQEPIIVLPDIVVHRRGSTLNLLVIEAKKSSAPSDRVAFDEQKLRAYAEDPQLRYENACMIEIDTGNRRLRTTWIHPNQCTDEWINP